MRFSRRHFTLSAAAAPFLIPTGVYAQDATPSSTAFAPAVDRLNEMLQYVPGGILDETLHLVWNDLEKHVAETHDRVGQAAGDVTDEEIASTALHSNVPDISPYSEILEELTGYSFDQILQIVQVGLPPAMSLVVKTAVQAESLIPFWESMDYESRENDYGTFWTLGEGGEIDLQHPVQGKLISQANNIAILEDDVIAYAPTSDLLGQLMATSAGETPNRVAELESLSAELAADATSAWYLDGNILQLENAFAEQSATPELIARVEEMIAESDDAVGAMPLIRTVCISLTAGGSIREELHNPETREFIILETDEPGMAEPAEDVIAWRLENLASMNTGEPYNQILPNAEIEVLGGEHLRLSWTLENTRTQLTPMIQVRDILLFAYQRD